MGTIARDIFKAIHEQKWLFVEYHNMSGQTTRYWIGINDLNLATRMLEVDGLHLVKNSLCELTLRLEAIVSTSVVEGTFHHTPSTLLKAIEEDERYEKLFGNIPNLKILDYYYDCACLNCTPYVKDFALISRMDEQSFARGALMLDDEQFRQLVRLLQRDANYAASKKGLFENKLIALNVLSLHTRQGLYVLAFKELRLDVKHRALAIGKNIVLNHEFEVVKGKAKETQSIRRFLDESELMLVGEFEQNERAIKDCIMERCGSSAMVDDAPHVFVVARSNPQYLQGEYNAICDLCREEQLTVPLKAFFGMLVRRPIRRKEFSLSLVNGHANIDQLLAINQAIKYPLTYVQGPPGTGKTSTIENAIVNAFCNGQTVLFASQNNHPVDGVFDDLTSLKSGSYAIPFPILRLGNKERMAEALRYMRNLYLSSKDVQVSRSAPRLGNEESARKAKELSELLKEYEAIVDLQERSECIQTLASSSSNLNFSAELQGAQLARIEKRLGGMRSLDELAQMTRDLTEGDHKALMLFLFVASLYRIQRLGEPKYEALLDIVMSDEPMGDRVAKFTGYLADPVNLKALQRIFPIMATTCISAHRLGPAEPSFDITIIDEASQCDTANALIPILRGRNLVLVGDPQQLNPVVMLDEGDNKTLRHTYQVPDEYDYIENSLYKTFLACDSVSNEILLHAHYRCDERIIDFNNKKYYNNKLEILSGRRRIEALEYIDVENDESPRKNMAPREADVAVNFALDHPELSIGIITPFANQRALIESELTRNHVTNATCGTVHSYQGDERDVILFSLALTNRTSPGTYRWLAENRELINVATSRARDRLVIVSNSVELERLHASFEGVDDIFELVQYVRGNGETHVTPREVSSRALGVKPYSTQTEQAFLETLDHALGTIFVTGTQHVVKHEVAIASVFDEDMPSEHLFFSGRFDFVVFEVMEDKVEIPVLVIELDGKEHISDEAVMRRDRQKENICSRYNLRLIRVENSYARRYHHIKEILEEYFKKR